MDKEPYVFVFEKDGNYKCPHSTYDFEELGRRGWKHVATLNARIWIEYTLNNLSKNKEIEIDF